VSSPRVALVHEWLVQPAGSELVLRELVALCPGADLFCLLDGLSDADRAWLGVGHPRTTWLQHVPGAARHYPKLLPLMPAAIASLDLRGYDLVVSSSHAVAKGVRVPAGVPHLCYCHSPMRYAWDMRGTYLTAAGLTSGPRAWAANWLLDQLQRWDRRTARGVTQFVANSTYVAQRIRRAYDRESVVVHPPVDTTFFTPDPAVPRGAHYVAASRLVEYKRIPLIVEAFRHRPDRQLVVIGDGPERARVRALAGPNVTVLGHVTRPQLRHELRRARALLFAAEEDFGILPVEAQACGTPVLALGAGGALESVQHDAGGTAGAATGRFFPEPTVPAILDALDAFETGPAIEPLACRRNAERFAVPQFRAAMQSLIAAALR
jgi:glycosyltransferase involved in cell wall biosynthesis